MKSAKQKKSVRTSLFLFLTVCSLLTSCVGCSRFSFLPQNEDGEADTPTDTNEKNDLPAISPADPTQESLYYNRYTGLACDKSILSCRPISVSIGNFDGNRQEGLALADILIETPTNSDETRIWALYTDHSKADKILGVSSIRDYMLPVLTAFGSIAAYAGNIDRTDNTSPLNGDHLDFLYHNLSSAFTQTENGGLSTSVKALAEASVSKGYSTTDSGLSLPYRHTEADTVFTPSSNRVQSISFRFSATNTVGFRYDEKTRLYQKEQGGVPHVDAQVGEQLAFSNVLLLFHNVSYYQTSSESSFELDSKSGGNGYLYTGGGVISVRWNYNEDGSLSIVDDSGEKITVNRGKTYIGMLRVTDSATLVAK